MMNAGQSRSVFAHNRRPASVNIPISIAMITIATAAGM
jgi:hypothetical protein